MKSFRQTFFLAPLAAGFLAACSSTGGYNSPDYKLPEGSTVEVTQTLKFGYKSTRTYIQGGESLKWNAVNRYAPFCSFGLNRNRDGRPLAREIPPTRFTTGDVRIGIEARANDVRQNVVASSDEATAIRVARDSGGSRGAGTPWPYTYYTQIELYSDEAPQVDDLTCAYDGDAVDKNLTLDAMRDTLGPLVRIY